MTPEPLLTAEEVAGVLKVSLSMVYKLRRAGALPGIQIGALWRFRPEVVRAVAAGEPPPVGPSAAVLSMGTRRRV